MGMSRVPSFSTRPGFPSGLRVLVLDENDEVLCSTSGKLRECSYEVVGCTSIADATDAVESAEEEFDILLCEACFVSDDTFAYFSKRASALPIVVMGANATREQKMAGVNAGAVDFLEKPLSSLKLRNVWQHTVRKILKQRASRSQSRGGDTDASPEPSDGDNKTRIKEEPRAADALRVPTLKAATEACHNESTGSSAADASPWSAATTAAPGGGSTAATGGTSAAATRQKCPSRERGARALRSAARAMQTRSCNSLDGTHSAQAPARAARAHSSGAPVAAVAQGAGSGGDSGAPGLAAPTLPPALTPMPSPAGSAPQYSLQGMPPPLPGCVWGLPMLPPPVPGLMAAPMMMPASGVMGPQPYAQMAPHWGAPTPFGGPVVPAPSHHAPASAPPVAAPAPAKGTAASFGTWSHDAASTETGLATAPWAELGSLPFDGADDVDGALRQFSADLLNDGSADVAGTATGDDGDDDAAGLKDIVGEKLPGDALEWMDEGFLMDDTLDKGAYLDIMA